jgi:hypothetical protein
MYDFMLINDDQKTSQNKPAAPNAGIASQLTMGHHGPGVGEPER